MIIYTYIYIDYIYIHKYYQSHNYSVLFNGILGLWILLFDVLKTVWSSILLRLSSPMFLIIYSLNKVLFFACYNPVCTTMW